MGWSTIAWPAHRSVNHWMVNNWMVSHEVFIHKTVNHGMVNYWMVIPQVSQPLDGMVTHRMVTYWMVTHGMVNYWIVNHGMVTHWTITYETVTLGMATLGMINHWMLPHGTVTHRCPSPPARFPRHPWVPPSPLSIREVDVGPELDDLVGLLVGVAAGRRGYGGDAACPRAGVPPLTTRGRPGDTPGTPQGQRPPSVSGDPRVAPPGGGLRGAVGLLRLLVLAVLVLLAGTSR